MKAYATRAYEWYGLMPLGLVSLELMPLGILSLWLMPLMFLSLGFMPLRFIPLMLVTRACVMRA
jgi:hypothetical protein